MTLSLQLEARWYQRQWLLEQISVGRWHEVFSAYKKHQFHIRDTEREWGGYTLNVEPKGPLQAGPGFGVLDC
jgi:hypothetical protein